MDLNINDIISFCRMLKNYYNSNPQYNQNHELIEVMKVYVDFDWESHGSWTNTGERINNVPDPTNVVELKENDTVSIVRHMCNKVTGREWNSLTSYPLSSIKGHLERYKYEEIYGYGRSR